jgi:hypothetical protein
MSRVRFGITTSADEEALLSMQRCQNDETLSSRHKHLLCPTLHTTNTKVAL